MTCPRVRWAIWEQVLGAAASAEAPATRVVLVSHAETDPNAAGGPGLAGRATQHGGTRAGGVARALALWRRDRRGLHLALVRASETASIVLAGRAVVPLTRPALRELSYGRLEGVAPGKRRAAWPDLDARWVDDPWAVAFPNGESLEVLAARVVTAWARIVAAHPGETVLVSGHGHVNRVILLLARRLSRTAFWDVAQPSASAAFLDHAHGMTGVGSAA